MSSENDLLLDAITDLAPKLLNTMEAFEQVQRNMHPSRLETLAEFIVPFERELRDSFSTIEAMEFPEDISALGKRLINGATYSLRACDGITNRSGDNFATMKAMRAQCRAQEFIYPLASVMTPVNQYFLEPDARENKQLLDDLNQDRPGQHVGILNARNERDSRGGFTLYVPEYLDTNESASLVIVLHGGTGHGADFLWSWLREARTRGFILMAPTSQQDTWSLMGEEHDLDPLLATLDFVKQQCNVDEEHILLTGMSDGATYCLLAGLNKDSPFTHLAPFSGVLHPEIQMFGRMQYARDRNIYLVHGTLDWMFPIETAYMAQSELLDAGANLTFRAVEDLSHAYCRAENPNLITWFNPKLEVPKSG
ncbi:MAG: phospholipase [Proteobacteria bacterium]|nr:phospholipase [Pseudomonadota bacterium]